MILLIRRITILSLAFALLTIVACEQESDIISELETASLEEVSIISISDLPSVSVEFIDVNFPDEEVVESYSIVTLDDVSYEAELSNETSLLFDEFGDLIDFGSEKSGCSGCRGNRKRGHSNGKSAQEIAFEDLPEVTQTYLDENYEDSLFIKALLVTVTDKDDSTITETSYHTLISTVGLLIFDSEGNFEEVKSRTSKGNSEEVTIEDLSETITTYIVDNYTDAVINKAKTRTIDDEVYTYVMLEDIGVLVFDTLDEFVELKEKSSKKRRN